jgi:acylphosphatase
VIRTNVIYRGHVQGVCFRATTQGCARDLAVTGFVRNLPDGSVELEVQGPADEVQRLLDAVAEQFARNIRDFSVRQCEVRHSEQEFRITN